MATTNLDQQIFELIERLRQMQVKADAQAAHQADLRDQLQAVEDKARALHPVILNQTDVEAFDLLQRLEQMKFKTEALSGCQYDLKAQLKIAEDKALALHQKFIEERCDLGGEG
jgi:hypothetical protein